MAVAHGASRQFEFYWKQQGEWVEEPNQRRGGESGVQRLRDDQGQTLYAKRQIGHVYRTLLHPFGRPTVLRELDALRSCQALGVRVPAIVFCGVERDAERQWRALLVSKALDGFVDLDTWHAQGARQQYGQAVHDALLRELAVNLARLHQGHRQHGCLYGKHVFVRVIGEGTQASVEVALLDLEKSRTRLSRQRAAGNDLRQLKRHSSLTEAEWQKLLYFYREAFGSAIKGLGVMKLEIARALFLVAALVVTTAAAAAWHEPRPQVLSSPQCLAPRDAKVPAVAEPDQDLLLFLFGMRQGLRAGS